MRILAVGFVLLVGVSAVFGAVNCAAIGQNGWVPRYVPEECYPARTFGFAAPASAARLKEVVQILKLSMMFVNVEVDESASTVTVRGSEEKLAMADWLLRELDKPAAKAGSRMDRYEVSPALQREMGPTFPKPENANDQVMGVFFLAHMGKLGIQELMPNLIIVGDVRIPALDVTGRKVVVRGSEAQLAMAKHFVDAFDVTPETVVSVPDMVSGTEVVRLFFPGQMKVSASVSQIFAALRDVVEMKHAFVFSTPAVVAVRGSADEIAAADWLIRTLETKPSTGASEFRFAGTDRPDNVLAVFYQPRAKVDSLKSSKFSSPDAVLFRGSASEIAAVELVMQ